jgi:hypothetical protein
LGDLFHNILILPHNGLECSQPLENIDASRIAPQYDPNQSWHTWENKFASPDDTLCGGCWKEPMNIDNNPKTELNVRTFFFQIL